MYIETKNKISKREAGNQRKNLIRRCFCSAVTVDATPVQDRKSVSEENWLSRTFSSNVTGKTQVGKIIKCTVDTRYR